MSLSHLRQILLIDHSATMCTILKNALLANGFGPEDGYQLVIAREFEPALKLIDTGDTAALVTDILMPGLGGLAGLGLVKKRWPDIPILAMSGGADPTTGSDALTTLRRLGIDGYLEQPFTMDVFVDSLRSVLTGKSKSKALVIDDSSTMRKIVTRMLVQKNFDTYTAGSIEEAFENPEIASMDLIIIDIFMPGAGGIVGIERLRESWPEISLVAISGGWDGMSPEDALQAARKIGADAVLKKPFDESALNDVLAGLAS